MKWSTFLKIVLLILITFIFLYITFPRYDFIVARSVVLRGNKITGKAKVCAPGYKEWRRYP